MFCRAACDTLWDEHQPHFQVVMPKTTEHGETQENPQATVVLKAMLWHSLQAGLCKMGLIQKRRCNSDFIHMAKCNIMTILYVLTQDSALRHNQTWNISWTCILTSWQGFVCFLCGVCVSVRVWLRLSEEGWLRWGLEPPSTQSLRRPTDTLTLLWTFRGGCRGHQRGQRSAFMLIAKNALLCPQQRQLTQTAHMNQRVLCNTCWSPLNIHRLDENETVYCLLSRL